MVPDLPATTFRQFKHNFYTTFLAYHLGRPKSTFIPYWVKWPCRGHACHNMGYPIWNIPCGIFHMGYPTWELHMGYPAWDIPHGISHMECPIWDIPHGISHMGYFIWDIPYGISHMRYPGWYIPYGISHMGYPIWDIPHGYLVCDIPHDIYKFSDRAMATQKKGRSCHCSASSEVT